MTTKRIINVFDLGPGDGGKGGVVHKYSTEYDAHTILKVGGAQGSHGVTTEGRSFAFSQWGCGTFENVPTHITSRFVMSPDALVAEANALQLVGVSDPWGLLTIDGNAICSTPYHGFSSRIRELLCGKNRRGTIGSGVGQAYRRHLSDPTYTFRAFEFSKIHVSRLIGKLEAVRNHEFGLVQELSRDGLLEADVDEFNAELKMFTDDNFLDYMINIYENLSEFFPVVNGHTRIDKIFNTPGTSIIENSHGILTDNVVGFNPHTSALRTLPCFNEQYVQHHKFDGAFVNIGVHRAYNIRHGAGPLPTHNPDMNEKLLPGSNKDENRYQGKVRVGPLDFVLLRYALRHSGKVDGLAITWFDQISKNGSWDVCDSYEKLHQGPFVSTHTDIPSCGITDITKALINVKPVIETIGLPESRDDQFELCCNLMNDKLKIPVDLVSFGPMDSHKVLKGLANV